MIQPSRIKETGGEREGGGEVGTVCRTGGSSDPEKEGEGRIGGTDLRLCTDLRKLQLGPWGVILEQLEEPCVFVGWV